MSFVYISYGPPDEELARYLQVQLEEAGYTAWLDEVREIDETMVSVLRSAIASAGAFIAVGGAGLGYPELVKWEIGIASQNGIPILALRSAADIPSILASLENLFEKPPALIPLPVPMRWETEQPTHRYRIGRIGWLILLAAVLLGAIWLVRIAILTPAETSEELLPALTAVPTEFILATETSVPSVPSVTPPPTTAPSATTAASPTVGLTPSETPSPTLTASPTLTLTPTASPTITPSPSPTNSPTATPSPTASPTQTPTASPSPTATATPTATPTATRTASPTPLVWPTAAPGEKWLTNTPAPGL